MLVDRTVLKNIRIQSIKYILLMEQMMDCILLMDQLTLMSIQDTRSYYAYEEVIRIQSMSYNLLKEQMVDFIHLVDHLTLMLIQDTRSYYAPHHL